MPCAPPTAAAVRPAPSPCEHVGRAGERDTSTAAVVEPALLELGRLESCGGASGLSLSLVSVLPAPQTALLRAAGRVQAFLRLGWVCPPLPVRNVVGALPPGPLWRARVAMGVGCLSLPLEVRASDALYGPGGVLTARFAPRGQGRMPSRRRASVWSAGGPLCGPAREREKIRPTRRSGPQLP